MHFFNGFSLLYFTTFLFLSWAESQLSTPIHPRPIDKQSVGEWDWGSDDHFDGSLVVSMATTALQKTAVCMLRASDENSLLALAIGTGQLEYSLNQMKTRPRQDNSQSIVNDIETTLGVLQTVRNDLLTYANYSVPKSHLSIFRILDKRFWRFSLSRREITNSLPCETFPHYVNPVEFLTEKQTDRCLLEITQQRYGVCSITDQCVRDMLDQMDCSAGYSGTHQLLFLLSYWRMNCGHYLYPSFDEVLSNCSRQMYSQFCAIQNEDYPSQLQDIYLEYVLFGGLAGFDEFMKEDILRKIKQWQHIDGCYYVSDDTEQSEDEKETIHKTSVASALLGVYASYFAQL